MDVASEMKSFPAGFELCPSEGFRKNISGLLLRGDIIHCDNVVLDLLSGEMEINFKVF